MYRDAYQRGLLTIFFSCGAKPLNIWDTYTQDGYITKFLDEDIKSTVLEIGGTNVSTTYMICPKGNQVLGITMPFLVMIVKNLKKYFSFEVTILDDTGTRRRFRVSNFQSTTQVLPLCTVMPISLSDGWNQIQFNLSDFCRRAYKKQFVEVQKCKINANIRIRRIYFADRIFADDKLPTEYKLFIPLKKRSSKEKPKDLEVVAPDKVPSAELQKRDSKTGSASKVDKVASVEKIMSKALEKPESSISLKKLAEENEATVAEGALEQAVATEIPVDAAEGPGAEPGAEPVTELDAEPVAEGEETVAAKEEGPEPGDAVTTEPVATAEEPVSEAEHPVAEAEHPVAEAEGPNETGETQATEEAETTEPVKVKSVEAATQYEPTPVENKSIDAVDAAGEEKTAPSAGRLETIEEKE